MYGDVYDGYRQILLNMVGSVIESKIEARQLAEEIVSSKKTQFLYSDMYGR